MHYRRRGALALAAIALAASAQAQQNNDDFPNRPVRIILPYAPGGATDMIARIVAQKLGEAWGQQVIVLNQPGGAGAVAIKAVAPAAPDGHTLYMSLASNFIALPELQTNFPVDVLRDFWPIGYVGDHPMVITAGRRLGVSRAPAPPSLPRCEGSHLRTAQNASHRVGALEASPPRTRG